jgi:hypothetical protein
MKDARKLKKALIAALVCLNVVLCLALVYGAATPRAEAQVRGGYRNDYLLVTGEAGDRRDFSDEALYVLDLANRRLAAWRFNTENQRLVPVRPGRELPQDFRRGEN